MGCLEGDTMMGVTQKEVIWHTGKRDTMMGGVGGGHPKKNHMVHLDRRLTQKEVTYSFLHTCIPEQWQKRGLYKYKQLNCTGLLVSERPSLALKTKPVLLILPEMQYACNFPCTKPEISNNCYLLFQLSPVQ